MIQKVEYFIKKNKLLQKEKPIICATSGGVDSVCLIHILKDLGYSLVLAHVNHHKREQSQTEEISMQNLAKQLDIPFEYLSYYDDHNQNFQGQAHDARYDFFKGLADQYHTDTIVTAHHLDDQSETILMRLISGSNLYGYAGISSILYSDHYRIVRPLLCVSKEELYAYAKMNHYEYFEDESNQSDDYFRNRIRHHMIPLLKEESPNVLEKLQEFSIQAKEAFDFIRLQSIKYLDELNNNIRVEDFKKLNIAVQKDIICLLLERFNISKNNEMILNCHQLLMQGKNKKIQLAADTFFQIEYHTASIVKATEPSSFYEEIQFNESCTILNRYHFYFSKKMPQNNAKYLKLCYNDFKFPFLIRSYQKGDAMEFNFGSKKVSRIFIDAKVPKEKRHQIPLIFDGNQKLLWVYPNHRNRDVSMQKETGNIYLVCEENKNV